MNWNAVGAIGEVVGALAVVVTLAYFATQVRQLTRRSQQDAITAFEERMTRVPRMFVVDEALVRLWGKGLTNWGSLTKDEQARVHLIWIELLNQLYTGYMLRNRGELPEDVYLPWEIAIVAQLNTEGGKEWGRMAGSGLHPDFWAHLRTRIESEAAAPSLRPLREREPWWFADDA
ncbi:MAG: hypothetical protein OEM63_02535 [Gammaproteobacteria bacterium]|nr:hypothetical protein [Gammaproteobacteria bacterium]